MIQSMIDQFLNNNLNLGKLKTINYQLKPFEQKYLSRHMTSSFSKYDRKQREDTVSQTGKRSFSQSSQHQQQTGDNSMNFDLSVQNLMPLIEHLKQQNQQLKHQRDEIQVQMTKLKSISEGILQENAEMRQHYQQRTEDIKKIVTTMSINMNQQIEDITHMTHMTRNHNYGIVKNIQKVKKQIQEKSQQVEKIQQELAVLAERNTLLNEEIITRNVKIKQMEEKINQIGNQRIKQDNLFKLQDEVDRLTEQVAQLRTINMKKLKNAQTIQSRNDIEKPQYTAENLNVIQTIKTLNQQLSQMKQDSSAFQKNVQTLKNYHKKVAQKCDNANKQREHQTLKLEEQDNQIKRTKQSILNNKTKFKQLQVKKSELEDQKYYLQKQKAKREQKVQKVKKQQLKQKQNVKKGYKEKSQKQKIQHHVEVQKNYDELTFKLNPEKERRRQALEELQEEYKDLQRQVSQMKLTVKNMDNPVKQIIRLEYELSKLKR